MSPELRELISAYLATSQELFSIVLNDLDIEPPSSNRAWHFLNIRQDGKTKRGIFYFKHGIGIDMKDGARSVRLDIGENGEIDGINPGFLADFWRENKLDITLDRNADIRKMLKEAYESGHLSRQSQWDLYFVKKRRLSALWKWLSK